MGTIVQNLHGEREYVTLPQPLWEDGVSWGTGIKLQALYRGPRTGRRFIETYSIWEDRQTHGVVGTRIYEAEESEWLAACERANIDPKMEATPL